MWKTDNSLSKSNLLTLPARSLPEFDIGQIRADTGYYNSYRFWLQKMLKFRVFVLKNYDNTVKFIKSLKSLFENLFIIVEQNLL